MSDAEVSANTSGGGCCVTVVLYRFAVSMTAIHSGYVPRSIVTRAHDAQHATHNRKLCLWCGEFALSPEGSLWRLSSTLEVLPPGLNFKSGASGGALGRLQMGAVAGAHLHCHDSPHHRQ